MNLAAMFLEVAASNLDRTALWARGEAISYRELRNQAAAISHAVVANLAVGAGDRIAVLSDRTPTAYLGVLAALLSGAAYVPLNPRYPVERNRSIVESSGALAVICDESNRARLLEIVQGLEAPPLCVFPETGEILGRVPAAKSRFDVSSPFEGGCPGATASPDQLAYVLFTSGSTGKPKGVPISHANVMAYFKNASALAGVTAHDRIIQLADLTFDISVHDIFVAWLNGASLYSVPERATLMAGRFVEEHEITGWFSVPSTAGLMKQSNLLDPGSMPSLRFTLFCGEALTGAVAEAWSSAAPNSILFNLYGPTEATVAFSFYRYLPGKSEPPSVVSLGEPFDGQEMGLFNAEGVRAEPANVGEICLSGSQVMAGYWRAQELNAQKLFQAEGRIWYRTGDLGRYEPVEGYQFAGRVDHQVKLRGFRVELQEIEAAVRKASGRDVVAVVPWPVTADGGATGCVAFIAGPETNEDAIRSVCQKLVPDYMVPGRILFVPEMPLNASGKVDYVRLRQHSALV